MVFTTYLFVFYFLPLVLVSYYALDGLCRQAGASDGRTCLVLNTLLAFASYIFYGWWNPWYIFLMLGITVVNYVCGRIIGLKGIDPRLSSRVMAFAIVVSLGTLGFFKYFTFLEANLNQVLAWFGAGTVRVLAITLPIGISFYTFHALSYTIDVHRGTAPPVRSFVDFACYIALFPQLVAGPIIRYNTVADQLVSRSHTPEKFASGVVLFILGFAKKILLANPMGRAADAAFDAASLTAPDAWFGAGLRLPDLLRFLRLFRHGHRAGSDDRLRVPEEFRFPLSGREHHRLLAALAHLAEYVLARLSLHSARGQPQGAPAHLRQPDRRHAAGRALAWRELDVRRVGGVSRHLAGLRAITGQAGRVSAMAATGPHGGHVRPGADLLGPVPLGELARGPGLPGGHDRSGGSGPGSLLLPALLYTRGTLLAMAIGAVVVAWPIQAHEWSREVTLPKAVLVHPLFCASLLAMFSQSFNPFLYFQF